MSWTLYLFCIIVDDDIYRFRLPNILGTLLVSARRLPLTECRIPLPLTLSSNLNYVSLIFMKYHLWWYMSGLEFLTWGIVALRWFHIRLILTPIQKCLCFTFIIIILFFLDDHACILRIYVNPKMTKKTSL